MLATGPRGPVAIVRRHPCGPDQPRDYLVVTCTHRRYIVGHVTGRLRTLHVGYRRYIGYTLVTTFVTFGYILSTLVSLGRYRRYNFCYRRYRRYNNACAIITATQSPDVSSRGGSKPNVVSLARECLCTCKGRWPRRVAETTGTQ